MITVEVHGLRLFGRHGVHEHEKRDGQDFVFDVELAVGDRGSSDRLEDAVDYRDVARTVQEVSDARSYNLLEALATGDAALIKRRRARYNQREVRDALNEMYRNLWKWSKQRSLLS